MSGKIIGSVSDSFFDLSRWHLGFLPQTMTENDLFLVEVKI
jgi:hypothetical protein